MSTDTDRIVNFCQSFHQFWSLPFQVAVSLYLLHQQVYTATVIDHTVAKKITACRFYRDPFANCSFYMFKYSNKINILGHQN